MDNIHSAQDERDPLYEQLIEEEFEKLSKYIPILEEASSMVAKKLNIGIFYDANPNYIAIGEEWLSNRVRNNVVFVKRVKHNFYFILLRRVDDCTVDHKLALEPDGTYIEYDEAKYVYMTNAHPFDMPIKYR